MRLDGYGLFVKDMGTMIQFYRDVLSYEYLKGVNGHSEMALYVDTYEEVDVQYQNAVAHGATSLLEPTTEPWGQRTCFIADPEGNIIEIGSWNKPYEEKDL